ncbi:amidase signature domain-containing protein [Aspergillus cavernicola]|uniref:amidase n=1 Tax=Aspergillus cavernicola TaxID=176166 RepID=A0ABR4HWW5_9EURO
MTEPTWKKNAAAKREEILSLIPPEWHLPQPLPSPSDLPCVTGKEIRQYLSPMEIEITETDAVGVVQKTSSGEWRCEDVVRAFCHRASLAHQMINCLHEIFFQAAIEDAKILDHYYDKNKKPYGSLHGLPISLKDSIHIKGVGASMGYVGWLDTFEGKRNTGREKVHESEIVKHLRALGAILYVKTSVPQGSFSGETVNHIIEHTPNPQNRNLVVGGSSGGEGGLLALRGSPIGLGTDIGGSIRVPAGWNGCYGLRPSTGRLPYEGIASTLDGQSSIPFVVGPLAHSATDLAFIIKALLSRQPWKTDPMTHEVPWMDDQFEQIKNRFRGSGERLSFGVLFSDGVVNPQPPVVRALNETVNLIRSLGHRVFEWHPPSHVESLNIWRDICLMDGGNAFHNALALSGEPPTPTVFGSRPTTPVDAREIMKRNIALRDYRKRYLDFWDRTAVDALITPFHQGPPPPAGKVRYMGYTCVVNVLDYPASVVPVTRVKKDIDKYVEGYSFLNHTDKLVYEDYDGDLLDGAPVGIQIVGRRLQEEVVLALTEGLSHELAKGRHDTRL